MNEGGCFYEDAKIVTIDGGNVPARRGVLG
jgi:hypothetical protein